MSGHRQYLMEDFFYAGGLRALMLELKDKLALSAVTVTGRRWPRTSKAQVYLRDVIHPLSDRSTPKARPRCSRAISRRAAA